MITLTTATPGTVLVGTPVVPGVVYGPVIRPSPPPTAPPSDGPPLAEGARGAEAARFSAAATVVAERLRERARATTGAAAEVLQATAELAADRAWSAAALDAITSGLPATTATAVATERFAASLTAVGGRMAERVTDLADVRNRVLAELLGLPEPGLPTPTEPSILLADDLTPADTADLDPALVIGIGTRLGGPTSHTTIIARQLGIPCIVGLDGADSVAAGTLVLLDAGTGSVTIAPPPALAQLKADDAARRAAEIAQWTGPGRTSDNAQIALLANVGDGAGARAAVEHPVEGIGLFRTELAFLDRADEPSVAEQAALYREVINAFPEQKVVIRTLDVGSDKPLRFVDQGDEENPALGMRGNRIAARNPEILERQLDAIALAAQGGAARPWVMAPMIATPAEAAVFAARCRARDLIPGVMIEVPAAALCATAILAEVDFASIGTNDLTQYTMAVDRSTSELGALTDPWQPAVLRLIKMAADAGAAADKPVGVCGEAAADPLLACVFVGLGVTSLSIAAGAAAAVGARLSGVTLDHCRWRADAALAAKDPAAARAAVSAGWG